MFALLGSIQVFETGLTLHQETAHTNENETYAQRNGAAMQHRSFQLFVDYGTFLPVYTNSLHAGILANQPNLGPAPICAAEECAHTRTPGNLHSA